MGEHNLDIFVQLFNLNADFPPGWYWWPFLPGCFPKSGPNGPFNTEALALIDAQPTKSYKIESLQ